MCENKNSYNLFFLDLVLIFIFYVLGDTITTWIALNLGHIEMNGLMSPILNSEYGIFIILGLKIMFFIMVLMIVIKYNNFKLIRYTTFFIMCFGIFLTISNSLVIITGFNIFQLIGVM